jgi:hypothetical protein
MSNWFRGLPFALLISLLGSSLLAVESQADPIGYTVGDLVRQGEPTDVQMLCRVDLSTGDVTPIGQVVDSVDGLQLPAGVDGLAFDPTSGILWGITGGEKVVQIDLETAVATEIGAISLNAAGYGMAADSTGRLYISYGDSGFGFAEIDKQTGMETVIRVTGAARATGLASDDLDRFYAVRGPGLPAATDMVEIEPTDGSFVPIGTGVVLDLDSNLGLASDATGQIWGIDFGSANPNNRSTVFVLDKSTGIAMQVSLPTDPVTGKILDRAKSLAINRADTAAVPLLGPIGLGLLISGLGAAGLRRLAVRQRRSL